MPIVWKNERRKVADLKEYEHNPRQFTKKGIQDLERSMKKLGYIDTIAINTDGTIIGGHARKKVLESLGIDTVDVRVPDRALTDGEIKEAVVRLNKNIAGDWDFDILANSFEPSDLMDWGFEKLDLGIVEAVEMPDLTSGDKAPFQQMTFTLHDDQVEEVKRALDIAKGMGSFIDT